ncbi:MAG: hypothetical protein HY801_05100 [Candidatus Lindowbacteria bacterium]|nr:hypothetical protein [Candidatus Lindowbacteria bacterium]
MGIRDTRGKKAAIRQEIKERMQREFDSRKAEIKARIKREKISVEEKREKYRHEVHEEKLRLMGLAKEEFIARKRMLGLVTEDEPREELFEEPPAIPPWALEEEPRPPQEHEDFIQHAPQVRAEEAFVYDDEEDSDVREFQSPIGETDVMPLAAESVADEPHGGRPDAGEPYGGQPQSAGAEPRAARKSRRRAPARARAGAQEIPETRNLFYYIINLIPHPIVTLDEFDDYLATRSGLFKVLLFYFVSLAPVVLFAMVSESIAESMPAGRLGAIVGSGGSQADPLMLVGQTVLNLLFNCFCISIVNYFATNNANFFTLAIYFGFVEAVTRVVIYTIVILAAVAALFLIASPEFMAFVGMAAVLLLLAYAVWTFALNMIVLMSAYGYDFLTALLLSLGAQFVMKVVMSVFIYRKLATEGFGLI